MGFISDVKQKVRSWLEKGQEDMAMERREGKNKKARQRYRRAAERLTENSSLRDELDDEQAKQVLDLGNAYLKRVADETADLTDREADNIVEAQTERVSRVIRQVNQLTGAIKAKNGQQLVDQYKGLRKKVAELKEEAAEMPTNVEEWLALSKENNDWVMKQLSQLPDGEEE